MRCEESPGRSLGMTTRATYKDITWGKKTNTDKNQYTFNPIYDWDIQDVWKAIHDNGWRYCKLYDVLYSYGVPLRDMRLSNVHHETAVKILFTMQEIDPITWSRLTKRVKGINTAGTLQNGSIKPPKELPYMFKSWTEYRDYLCDYLVTDSVLRDEFKLKFAKWDLIYIHEAVKLAWNKVCITAILCNDSGTKLSNFHDNFDVRNYYRRMYKGNVHESHANNKFIIDALKCSNN